MFLLYLLYFSNFVFLFIDYKFSTFIWKFYHVINKSATVYPLAGNMFTACYLLYRVKILTISGTLDHVGAFGRPCKKHGKHQCCEDHQTDKPDPEPFFYFHKDLFSRLFKDQDHQACCK